MKTEKKVVVLSIILGLFVWFFDAVLDYFVFYEGTFWGLLISDIPGHEVYVRLVVLAAFATFGIVTSRIISQRKRAEKAVGASHRFLEIANRHMEMIPLLKEFVAETRKLTGCTAVGIRLLDKEGNISYQAYEGFIREFYESESPLSIKCDQCICIYVIKGEVDPKVPFYTERGSFYINGFTRFLASLSKEEKRRTRGVCAEFGYESVGLVAVRSVGRILGLIHVADPQENMVPMELVELLEEVAMQLGIAIQRVRVEEEREQLVAELEARNAELERFTYTVSHDLKCPLITIEGFLGQLERDGARGKIRQMQGDIARIRNAAQKMQQLLDELLELSRIGRVINPPQAVPLGELAREAVSLVDGQIAKRGGRVEIAPHLPVVFGDRPRLLEVLQNLIDNATKFMGDQPQPHVEIGVREIGVRLDGAEDHEPVCYVRDNGAGIDPRYHQKVFGLFNQLDGQTEGTGVGLALVKRIVEVHGGRIWVESKGLGQGSTFCFTIPQNKGTTNDAQ